MFLTFHIEFETRELIHFGLFSLGIFFHELGICALMLVKYMSFTDPPTRVSTNYGGGGEEGGKWMCAPNIK